jgi:hypothetical protein
VKLLTPALTPEFFGGTTIIVEVFSSGEELYTVDRISSRADSVLYAIRDAHVGGINEFVYFAMNSITTFTPQ